MSVTPTRPNPAPDKLLTATTSAPMSIWMEGSTLAIPTLSKLIRGTAFPKTKVARTYSFRGTGDHYIGRFSFIITLDIFHNVCDKVLVSPRLISEETQFRPKSDLRINE